MLKALASLLVAGAAALAVASPAAAAPNCHNDSVMIFPGPFSGSFLGYSFDTSQFCGSSYTIIDIDYVHGSNWYYFSGSYGYIDGIYSGPETATITVTDGIDIDTFDLTIKPCFDDTYPYDDVTC